MYQTFVNHTYKTIKTDKNVFDNSRKRSKRVIFLFAIHTFFPVVHFMFISFSIIDYCLSIIKLSCWFKVNIIFRHSIYYDKYVNFFKNYVSLNFFFVCHCVLGQNNASIFWSQSVHSSPLSFFDLLTVLKKYKTFIFFKNILTFLSAVGIIYFLVVCISCHNL